MRPWLERLEALGGATLENLNRLAEHAGARTLAGKRVQFVAPSSDARYYEVRVFESGCVESRPESLHDLFNALAWLAFPHTKARINALHAARIPLEGKTRGRLRDLLTIFDEGGAIVPCADPELVDMIRNFRWKDVFWARRERVRHSMRIVVLGHAVLEMSLDPWPGIACKALFTPPDVNPDESAAAWLAGLSQNDTPALLAPLPIFGYPGWDPANENPAYYDDTRYFRPFRRDKTERRAIKSPPGVGQAAAVHNTEESPGSAERDAG